MERKNRFSCTLLFWMLVFLYTIQCHGDSDEEYSGGSWVTPIPNLSSAMEGFDPFSSNPFEQPDPGSRGQIFEPFEELEDGRVAVNSFIDKLRENIHCDTDFSSTTIKDYHQYRIAKSAGYTFSSNESAQVSVGQFFFSSMSSFGFEVSQSKSERNTLDFFQAGVGEIVESVAECVTHTVSLSSFTKPTFTKSFIQSLRSLHKAATDRLDDPESTRIFTEFVKDYGTHYMKTTSLGARLIFEKRFSSSSSSYEQERERQRCIATSARRSLGGGIGASFSAETSFSVSSQKCEGPSSANNASQGNRFTGEKIITIGTLPTESLDTWAEKAKVSPVPVRVELEKISFLFKEEWLRSIAVNPKNPNEEKLNATAIYDFFEEKTSQYCQLMTGQDNCEFTDKGCGLTSNCPNNTKCIDDENEPDGYKCQQYGEGCVDTISIEIR